MFKKLYQALARPHLEYVNQIWSLSATKDIKTSENVQRRATKMIPELNKLSHEERLREINIAPLAYGRLRGEMIKTINITTDKEATEGMIQMDEQSTRGHDKRLLKA